MSASRSARDTGVQTKANVTRCRRIDIALAAIAPIKTPRTASPSKPTIAEVRSPARQRRRPQDPARDDGPGPGDTIAPYAGCRRQTHRCCWHSRQNCGPVGQYSFADVSAPAPRYRARNSTRRFAPCLRWRWQSAAFAVTACHETGGVHIAGLQRTMRLHTPLAGAMLFIRRIAICVPISKSWHAEDLCTIQCIAFRLDDDRRSK